MLKRIIKRDGSVEAFDAAKLNKWSRWASEDLGDKVDWSNIVLHTVKSFGEEAQSQELQKKLIANCVQTKLWSYCLMAGRLYSALHRKELYGNTIPTVKALVDKLVDLDLMVKMDYDDEEYALIETIIDHTRDFRMAHFQLEQIRYKYSITNKITKEQYETPQFVFMRMAMALAADEPKEERLVHLKNWYDHFSFARVNAPTPNYVNLGTKHNGFASCCLITAGDSAASLAIGDHIAYTMTYMSAGIGTFINSRSMGDLVRNGVILHRGKLPYFRSLAGAVKANVQGGRGGACTSYFSCFDPEVATIIMLQNPRTTRDKQNRDIHFAMLYNRLFVKKVAKNEQMFVFNQHTAPDLVDKFFSDDQDGFEELYVKYDNDSNFPKKYISARDIAIMAGQQSHEVATLYLAQIDEMNRHTSFKEKIYSSNLCVAPETKILTIDGHKTISKLEDQTVKVWNGEQWSEVVVRRTNHTANMITVKTYQGFDLTCTVYHKFYVVSPNGEVIEKQAGRLQSEDVLIELHTPFMEGSVDSDNAYVSGMRAGKFTTSLDYKNVPDEGVDEYNSVDMFLNAGNVPSLPFTIKARLDWLAGLIDSSGQVVEHAGSQKLVITSICKEFITDILLMLQTLGLICRIKDFHLSDYYQLEICNNEIQKLLVYGLKCRCTYIAIHDNDYPTTDRFRVCKILDQDRIDSTYCFEEPLRHMGVFNGILTGQCLEVTQPTSPYTDMTQLYADHSLNKLQFIDDKGEHHECSSERYLNTQRGAIKASDIRVGDNIVNMGDYAFRRDITIVSKVLQNEPEPEVSLCSIAGIVVPNIHNDEDYESACYYALKMIDKCIHMSSYALPHVGYTAKNRLNAGVGMLGLAYSLAKKELKYDNQAGLDEIHAISERHAYYVIKASLRLGQELGNAPWIDKTKWPLGWLPIDTYKAAVDEIVAPRYNYDWKQLRKDIIDNKGIRNSSLIAHMPTESSSKASGVPNGIYPIRDLSLKKTDAENALDWCAVDNDILADSYQLAWNIASLDMIKSYAVVQKFTDHSISADFYKDRSKGEELTTKEIIEEFLNMVKYGVKAKYYQNTFTVQVNKLDDKEDSAINAQHECVGACSL